MSSSMIRRRRTVAAVGLLTLLTAALVTVAGPNTAANAQTATTYATPVNPALDNTQSYFVVVSSEDGIIEAVASGTEGMFGYPAAAGCEQRLTAVPGGTQCFTSTTTDEAIGFQGTAVTVRAALATLTFTPNAGVVLSDARIQVSVTLNPGPNRSLYFNPDNGHYYEFVSTNANPALKPTAGDLSITWADAKAGAASRSLLDESGYLATITSLAESRFIARFVDGPNVWIGASDEFAQINVARPAITISAGARTANVVTITTAAPHGLLVGETAPVAGFDTGFVGLNGVHIITDVPTATSLQFAQTGADIVSGTSGTPELKYATQTASEGQWYWVTGPETGQQFWRPGTSSQVKGDTDGGQRVLGRFEAWKSGQEPNDSSGEHFAILNFGSTDPESNWNDFAGTNVQVKAYLVEFGPFPSGAAALEIDLDLRVVDLIPSAGGPVLTCTPDPVVPGGTVTCEITRGPANFEILWNASFNGPFAGAGVMLDRDGRGTFTFTAPRAAAGQSLSVVLVGWTQPISVAVTGQALPGSLPAGEGSGNTSVPALLLGLMAGAVWRLRTGSVTQAG